MLEAILTEKISQYINAPNKATDHTLLEVVRSKNQLGKCSAETVYKFSAIMVFLTDKTMHLLGLSLPRKKLVERRGFFS